MIQLQDALLIAHFFSISSPVSSLQTLIMVVGKRQCMQIIFFLTAFIYR